ncbi:MAG: hypothetical protein SFZ03_01510 [Candidatus Melainabacteria bacterium]|nr:hypothetical protein [Candidatus Melainabacteria bacterium]
MAGFQFNFGNSIVTNLVNNISFDGGNVSFNSNGFFSGVAGDFTGAVTDYFGFGQYTGSSSNSNQYSIANGTHIPSLVEQREAAQREIAQQVSSIQTRYEEAMRLPEGPLRQNALDGVRGEYERLRQSGALSTMGQGFGVELPRLEGLMALTGDVDPTLGDMSLMRGQGLPPVATDPDGFLITDPANLPAGFDPSSLPPGVDLSDIPPSWIPWYVQQDQVA